MLYGVVCTIVNVYLPCDNYANVENYLDFSAKSTHSLKILLVSMLSLEILIAILLILGRHVAKTYMNKIDTDLISVDHCLPSSSHTFVSDAWQVAHHLLARSLHLSKECVSFD